MAVNDRDFTISDGRLMEYGTSVASFLPDDLADFSAFDSTFNHSFIDNLRESMEDVRAVKSDDVVVDEQSEHTDKVREKMEQCNEAYTTVAFFVRKAFDDNRSVQNQFGMNDISEARNNQLKMIQFMQSLAKTAARYKDQLVEGGINPEVIDTLPQLSEELEDANNRQEMFKKERPGITQERVKRLNKVYHMLSYVSDIAKIIYADNPAQLNKYKMPTPRTSTDSEDDLITS